MKTATPLPLSYRLSRGVVLPLALLALWQTLHQSGLTDPRILPPPATVLARFWHEVSHGGLWRHLAASLARDMAGFALGASLGLLAGCALGLSRWLDRLFGPSFNTVKQIAVFAWIPLISVWFGVGEAAKVAFIALAAFTPVVVNTHEGIRGLDPRLRELARVFRLSRRATLFRVVLPGALPSIATGMHLALIYAWLATVGAEYFMTVGPGIGGLMTEGREHFHMDTVLLGVAILGLVGFLLNTGATLAEHRLMAWRRR